MQTKTFFILGFVGLAVTAFLHITLLIMLDNATINFFTFYIVWIVFIAIGIGKSIKDKKETS